MSSDASELVRRSQLHMPRRLKRRETEIFSISFLDCITCGLGSVVLLLVLSKCARRRSSSRRRICSEQISKLQDELIDIAGQTEILNRDLKARQQQLSKEKLRIARLQGDLSDIRGKYRASKQEADVANELEGRLASAQQTLTEEMKRLLGQGFPPQEGRCDRRHSGRQRIHHLHHRHVGQHVQLRLADDAAEGRGDAQPVSAGEGLPGDERRRDVHVHRLSRQVDSRHAGAAPHGDRPAAHLECVLELEPDRRHRRGDPHVLLEGQEDQPVRIRRRVHRSVDRFGRQGRGCDQSRGRHRRAPRAHSRYRFSGAAGCPAVHQHPLCDPDADTVPAQRRHVRRAGRPGAPRSAVSYR